MVEVFRIDVDDPRNASDIGRELNLLFPGLLINFDLEDCDRILRVEGEYGIKDVGEYLVSRGYFCKVLEA